MTWWRQRRTYLMIIGLTVCIVGGVMGGILFYQMQNKAKTAAMDDGYYTVTSKQNPVSYSPVLEWEKDENAVFYEVALSKEDAYLVTGNIKHFPVSPIVVTPAEMVEILGV